MIKSIAELLRELQTREAQKLAEYELTHAPSIGDMYEGLTKKVLEQSIPPTLDLRVVDGFVINGSGTISPQLDLMIVTGSGEEIPHTTHFKWHVRDVICVIEVKKTLHSAQLKDAFEKLSAVLGIYGEYLTSGEDAAGEINIRPALRAFEKLTGRPAPTRKEVELRSQVDQQLYHILVIEQLSPLRVAIGYEGFKKEESFRSALCNYLESNIGSMGFGPMTIPQLMVSGSYSLVKLTGQPYLAPMEGAYIPLLASTAENPIRLFIELLWTRLIQRFDLSALPEEDLEEEVLHRFLSCRHEKRGRSEGWIFDMTVIPEESLREATVPSRWEPQVVDKVRYVVVHEVFGEKAVRIGDKARREYIEEEGQDPDEVYRDLVHRRLVTSDGKVLYPIGDEITAVFLKNGEVVLSNQPGHLRSWVKWKLGEDAIAQGDDD